MPYSPQANPVYNDHPRTHKTVVAFLKLLLYRDDFYITKTFQRIEGIRKP